MKILEETIQNIYPLDKDLCEQQTKVLARLLKTPDGLGKMEKISIQLAGMKKDFQIEKKAVVVMAADNGVEKEGVSASKRVITQFVVDAMARGEASVSSLSKSFGSELFVVDLGIDCEKHIEGSILKKIMKNGTCNIRHKAAMTRKQAIEAIETGITIAEDCINKGFNLFALGEMGIGNTTTSSACLKVLIDLPLDDIVGYGSGINDETLKLKKQVIQDALDVNKPNVNDPIDIIHKVGGLDIAAMTGFYLGAARYKVPVVLDGLISGIAALLAMKFNAFAKDYMIPSHLSEEPGSKYILRELGFEPALYMNMKLGEGSGAILMFPIIEASNNLSKNIRLYPELR